MNEADLFDPTIWVGSGNINLEKLDYLRQSQIHNTLATYLAICKRALDLNLPTIILDQLGAGRKIVGQLPKSAIPILFSYPITVWAVKTCSILIAKEFTKLPIYDNEKQNSEWLDAIAHLNRVLVGIAALNHLPAKLTCFAEGGYLHIQPLGLSIPSDLERPIVTVDLDGNIYIKEQSFRLDDTGPSNFRARPLTNAKGPTVDPFDPLFQKVWINSLSFPYGLKARTPLKEELDHWIDMARGAFSSLEKLWPEMVHEINHLQTIIIPVITSNPSQSVSHSSDYFFGAVLVSNADVDLFNESLVHEHCHNVMYGLLSNYPMVTHKGLFDECHYSPWRPDARPIYGLLHAVYVFSRVCEYYVRLVNARPADKVVVNRLAFLHARVEIGCLVLRGSENLTQDGIALINTVELSAPRIRNSFNYADHQENNRKLSEHFNTWCMAHQSLNPPIKVIEYLSFGK